MSLNNQEITICHQYLSELKKNIADMKCFKYEYHNIKELNIYEDFIINTKLGQEIDNKFIDLNNKLEKTIKLINELSDKTEQQLYTQNQENNDISSFGGEYYE